MNQDDFVAGVLYRSALNDEQVWRKDPKNCHDVKLFDEMIAKIRKLGYNYKYYPDISMRRHEDPELIDIIADYLGKFTKEGITAELVRSIGTKSGQVATVRILDSFFNLTDQSKRKHAAFYDEALRSIGDRRYIDEYLKMIRYPECARRLDLLMNMLGKWKDERTKQICLEYLYSTDYALLHSATTTLGFYKNDLEVIDGLKACRERNADSPPEVKLIDRALKRAEPKKK